MPEIGYRERCLSQQIRACYVCGTDEDLVVHHRNGNRDDNRLENLIPVCWSCHAKIHTRANRGPVIDRLSEELPETSFRGVDDEPHEKVSVSFPGWMLEQIDERRGNVPRSVWIQYAIQARLNAEDAEEWDEPELAVADGGAAE